MRYFPILLILLVSISCSEQKTENGDLLVIIDTVMVDANDELIFLQSGLSHSALSSDQKKLFNFTPESKLEVIDLDDLKLQSKISTEKEGNLGTGWPYAIQFDQSENFVFYSFNELRIFDPNLSTMKRYSLTEDALKGLKPEILAPFNPKITVGNELFGIYETYETEPKGLAIVSLEDGNVEKIPLESIEKIASYTHSLFVQGRLSNRVYDPIYLALANRRLIISTAYSNEVLILDLDTKTTLIKPFHSTLTEDFTKVPVQTRAESIDEMERIMKEREKNVKFGPFIYDSSNNQFVRFSRKLDREKGDSLIYKTILTVYDKDLNQLGETIVLADPFSKKFFKDGKLWSYVNVEDELGFAVFTFDF
ncbi:DUF4221 family protein [Algoriphagus sp. PAP.12]|uniref:DUF4221 family protein n=1 Tax=Algoriphagus sp. PAP.12 TaxID=2996678 RepID=UPI00227CB77C|nr:DUF4221 family protein [Algoriphagus sp. PAP.12]